MANKETQDLNLDIVLEFLITNKVANIAIDYDKELVVITERFGSETTWEFELVEE